MGEASKHIFKEFKDQYPNISLAEVAGMRNILIHEYNDADNVIVWDTVKKHLLPLKRQLKGLLEEHA